MRYLDFKITYHSHTIYCGHANNTATEMAKAAFDFGLTKYGISEHLTSYVKDFDLDKYEYGFNPNSWLGSLIKEMVELKAKYKGKMEIFFGLEAEYIEFALPFYRKLLTHPEIDYIILGNHGKWVNSKIEPWEWLLDKTYVKGELVNPKHEMLFSEYVEHYEKALKANVFAYFAHPDFLFRSIEFMHSFKNSKKMQDQFSNLCKLMVEYDKAFGFNIKGHSRKVETTSIKDKDPWYYPNVQMWKIIKANGVKTFLELDAHDVGHFNFKNIQNTYATALRWGLDEQIVLDIDLLKMKKSQ